MGRGYVKLNRPHEAIDFLRRAVKLLPQQVEARYWRGKTPIQIGQTKEGRRSWHELNRSMRSNGSKPLKS